MCQLSSLFLFFSSLGYSILALHHNTHLSLVHHLVPNSFLFLLGMALYTTSQMANEYSLFILRPRLYFFQDPDTSLRRVLLLLCVIQCIEPVAVAYTRVISDNVNEVSFIFNLNL